MANYFHINCEGGTKNKSFWDTVRPFITDKGSRGGESIMLREDNEIIVDGPKVCTIFNDCFATIADGIGVDYDISGMSASDIVKHYENHSSITKIKESNKHKHTFSIRPVTISEVCKTLEGLNAKKAVGHDAIPPKLIKMAARPLSASLTAVINYSISQHTFPSDLKKAEISPIFKKDDALNKTKYRPVSVLPVVSKIYERLLDSQSSKYFYSVLSTVIAAYRKHHSCQDVLLSAVDNWKQALDNDEYVGAILMDLSKAFDSIPHGLLIAKLSAYGADNETCELFLSYLTGRLQRTKIGEHRSEWTPIK